MPKVERRPTVERLLTVFCVAMIAVFVLSAVGCGSEASDDAGPGLPAEPTAAQVVAAALTWIEQDDSTALGGPFSCFYEKGGERAVFVNGSAIVSGREAFLEIGSWGLEEPADGAPPSLPRYLRVSAADFPDKASVERAGRELGLLFYDRLFLDPLLAMRVMDVGETVERAGDPPTFTVEGVADINDILALFIGSQAVSWGEELEVFPSISFPVTLLVDENGRPLETVVTHFGHQTQEYRFLWSRGVWRPADTQTVSVEELVKLHEEGR
jgi:hypothetical protein